MTKDDVLFGYRQQLFAEAARTNVSAACRTFGVHRSTYYAWKRQVDRHGLEMLRPRERRRPQMPNAFPKMIEARIVSFSIAHPGLGPRRVSSELAREKWGAIVVSPNGVWKVLCRHGLNTRSKRLGLIAGYAAPYEPPRDPGPEQHIDVSRPGELVGIDCLRWAAEEDRRRDLAANGDRHRLLLRLGGTRDLQTGQPTGRQTSKLAERVARELKDAGWRLERLLSDNGNEFKGGFTTTIEDLKTRHTPIHAGRPQTNGNVEALHKPILDECWRPAFARYIYPSYTGLKRELDTDVEVLLVVTQLGRVRVPSSAEPGTTSEPGPSPGKSPGAGGQTSSPYACSA
jgi:transposase